MFDKFQSPRSGWGYSDLLGNPDRRPEFPSFNPLDRGGGILTYFGTMFDIILTFRFNPLDRGGGILTYWNEG